MKLLIASDIHGSSFYCGKLIEAIERENPQKVILLGDILYHGPRNELPLDYAPKKVIEMLNPLKNILLCVRGNCDGEVDQMVLSFPIMADYMPVFTDGLSIYATHGHIYNENNPLPMEDGAVLLNGHTHIPACIAHEGYTYMNPGSVSIPKENSEHSYMTYENRVFTWKNMEGKEYNKCII